MARLVFECQDPEECVVFFVTSEKEGKELAASYSASKQWLLENGLTPVKASVKRSKGNSPSPTKAPAKKAEGNGKVQFDGQHCPRCHGAIWDNRQKKAEDVSRSKWPDFSCKDKTECKWAVWPGQYEMAQAAS